MPDPHDLIRTMPAQGVVSLKRLLENKEVFLCLYNIFLNPPAEKG
jgi:hypothetical protein